MKTNSNVKDQPMKTDPNLQDSLKSYEKLANRDFERYPGLKLGTVIAIATAFLTFGVVAYSAIGVDYSGQVRLNIGADGMQLQIDKERK